MLNPDFKDMLSCLKEAEVDFIIVGAYALAAHGFPRATGDIDIWVRSDAPNARRVMRALARFGAPLADLSENDFLSGAMVVQLGVEPGRIDILTDIDGVTFDEAWRDKMITTVAGLEINILSKTNLLKNKLAAGREKDQGDIAWLKKNRHDNP